MVWVSFVKQIFSADTITCFDPLQIPRIQGFMANLKRVRGMVHIWETLEPLF